MNRLSINSCFFILTLFLFSSASAAHFSSSPQCKLNALLPLEKYLGKSDVKFRKYFPSVHEGNYAGESIWSVYPKDFKVFEISPDVRGVTVFSYRSIVYLIAIGMPKNHEAKSLIKECGEPSGDVCVKYNKEVEVALGPVNNILVGVPKIANKLAGIKDRRAPCDRHRNLTQDQLRRLKEEANRDPKE